MIDVNGIDLNLLRIFIVLFEERHVTRAAKRLRITQPAVSMGLARLREMMNDELFVRSRRDMVPTEKANRIGPMIQQIFEMIQSSLDQEQKFDPAKASADIRISVDDYLAQVVVLPVIKQASAVAPKLRFEIVPLRDRDPNRDLQIDLDFAIRAIQRVSPNLYSKKLMTENYRVLVSRNHARIKKELTLKDYTEQDHVLVSPFGGFNGTVDAALEAKGLRRNVRCSVGHFALGPMVVKDSQYLLTLPASIAESYESLFGLCGYEPPLKIPSFSVHLYWHERVHRSPLHLWLRSLFRAIDS
jgi:DNA-binding transcriptional LysR family regulator